eukprot:1181637-Amphidinium_carterae.1
MQLSIREAEPWGVLPRAAGVIAEQSRRKAICWSMLARAAEMVVDMNLVESVLFEPHIEPSLIASDRRCTDVHLLRLPLSHQHKFLRMSDMCASHYSGTVFVNDR